MLIFVSFPFPFSILKFRDKIGPHFNILSKGPENIVLLMSLRTPRCYGIQQVVCLTVCLNEFLLDLDLQFYFCKQPRVTVSELGDHINFPNK